MDREKQLTPLVGSAGPGDLKTTGDGVRALARLVVVLPTEALHLEISRIGLVLDVVGGGSTVCLAKGVAACNQSKGLLIVHGHAAECSTDIPCGSDGVRNAIRALRVDVDQTHVRGCGRVLEVAAVDILGVRFRPALVTIDGTRLVRAGCALRVADIVAQPGGLSSPVHRLISLPLVGTATSETESLDAHVLESDCK